MRSFPKIFGICSENPQIPKLSKVLETRKLLARNRQSSIPYSLRDHHPPLSWESFNVYNAPLDVAEPCNCKARQLTLSSGFKPPQPQLTTIRARQSTECSCSVFCTSLDRSVSCPKDNMCPHICDCLPTPSDPIFIKWKTCLDCRHLVFWSWLHCCSLSRIPLLRVIECLASKGYVSSCDDCHSQVGGRT